MRSLRNACGWVVLVLISTGVHAAEGRIPIFEPTVLDGTVGDISGKYVVTRNVEVGGAFSPPFSAISIAGSGGEVIDIDLNGFTLGGALFDPSPVIEITNVKTLKLRNGAIVSTVSALACAVIDAEQVILEDLTMTCGHQGLTLTSVKSMEIRRNTIESEGGGISVDGDGGLKGSIENNLLSTGGQQGGPDAIAVDEASSGIILRGNQIEGGGSAGIRLSRATGALVVDNSLKGLAGPGIVLAASNDCRIINNSAQGMLRTGIQLSETRDSMVLNNVSNSNGGHGLALLDSDRNQIDRNGLNGNGTGPFPSWGLFLDEASTDNTFGRNAATGNLGDTSQCSGVVDEVCGAPNLCDEGGRNRSFGDNLVPGPPPC